MHASRATGQGLRASVHARLRAGRVLGARVPLHKPKFTSVLVQFTLDVRVVARVTDRVRTSRTAVAERELTLPRPVVVRMPLPTAPRLLAAHPAALADPRDHLGLRTPAAPPLTGP